MDTSEFKEVFAAEARDYFQSLNEDLLALENDPKNKELLDNMFRAAHSLKGMAGTMGFAELAGFTHQMENVLDLLRTGDLQANSDVINVLFQSVDTLEVVLEQTIAGEQIADLSQAEQALERIALAQASSEAQEDAKPIGFTEEFPLDEYDRDSIKQGISQGYRAYLIKITLRANTLLKSVRVYTVFQALEEIGTIIKCNPSAQDLEDERFDRDFRILFLSHESSETAKDVILGISEIDYVEVVQIDQEFGEDASSRKAERSVEGKKEEKSSGLNDITDKNVRPHGQSPTVKASQSTAGTIASVKKRMNDTYVRVETERLDKLINLVGELVIARTQVLEMGKGHVDSDDKGIFDQLDRTTTDLQYAAMKLRMVPIKQVFDRFPRMVRDLAQSRGKSIRLEMFGEDTELDRSIVNEISDPLVHLIRNSIDHGIESADVRRQKGKPESGTITLGARHEGSHILIEISDDGQGIDVAKVKSKAMEKGLLSSDYRGELSVAEAIDLLFEPGFSTASEVTDISGRGVGMDAVKAAVEALSGSVEMKSQPGDGSQVTIKLPLTLAIIKALLVSASGETFAIPIQSVRENLLVTPDQIKTVHQKRVIVLRNEVLPLFDLAECLGFEPNQHSEAMSVIVTETRGEKTGFIVDDLIGQQEIVIKSLDTILGDIPGIAGAAVLGNGRVALILDNSTLIRQV